MRDHEPHEELFDLLVEYLELLDAGPARPAALRAFELGALRAAGLMPRLDACARCGGRSTAAGPARFDAGQGGVLCPRCAPDARPSAPPRSRPRPRPRSCTSRRAAWRAPPPSRSRRRPAARSREALTAFIEHHLGRRLAARRFLDEVGPLLGE